MLSHHCHTIENLKPVLSSPRTYSKLSLMSLRLRAVFLVTTSPLKLELRKGNLSISPDPQPMSHCVQIRVLLYLPQNTSEVLACDGIRLGYCTRANEI
jgi:hypothetical protein